MANSLYILVQNVLIDVVNDFALEAAPGFREISYDTIGRASLKEDGGSPVVQQPKTIRANEINEALTEDERFGRSRNRISENWGWQLHVKFNRPVEFQGFKDRIKNSFSIERNEEEEIPEIFLDFLGFDYAHPVEVQGSSSGSEFLATVNARIIRRV